VALLEGVDAVTAARRFAHHGEGRVLVNLEAGQRIGEESDFHVGSSRGNAQILAGNADVRGKPPRPAMPAHLPDYRPDSSWQKVIYSALVCVLSSGLHDPLRIMAGEEANDEQPG
jgi:hypothetical protein